MTDKQNKPSGHYSISVVILAFNERETVEQVVTGINSELKRLFPNRYEILIIDDGSNDGTEKIADDLEVRYTPVTTIHHEKNEGLGGVYRTAFSNARNDFVTFFPADSQMPASNIRLFAPLLGEYDLVLGYLPARDSSILAKILSKLERILYKLAFGEFPKFQGGFLFRTNLLQKIELTSYGRGWAIVMELIIRVSRGPYRITSIPIECSPRVSGKSKVNNLRTVLSSLRQLVYLYRKI